MTLPPLYQHQADTLERMRKRSAYMIANDAGTGKTRVMIEDVAAIARAFRVQPRPAVVIIAPSGVHDETWPYELARFWPHDVSYRLHVYHSGEGKRKQAARKSVANDTPRESVPMLCVHAESLSYDSGVEAVEAFCRDAAKHQRRVVFLIDEVHMFKTPSSSRTKHLTRLVHTYRYAVRGASGTLVGKGHEDLFAPYRMLDPRLFGKTFAGFKARFCVEQSMGGRFTKIVAYRDLDTLYNLIAPITSRVRRQDCLDLPERTFVTRVVPMSAEQERIQQELVTRYVAEMDRQGDTVMTATEASTRLIRLAQIANGYVVADGAEHIEIESGKPAALVQALEEYGDEKVVVWCRFRPDVNRIMHALEQQNITAIRHDGSMTKEDRAAALIRWRDPNGPRVLVATMKTLGVGRTLNEATLAVFYSRDFDHVLYTQTLARNYRAGQKERIVVLTLSAKHSADETISKNLANKDKMQEPIDQLRFTLQALSTPATTP